MQGAKQSLAKERSSAELRFASSLAPFWVWPGRRQGSVMNAYGALDPNLATRSLSCAFLSLKQPKKGIDNADVVIHGTAAGRQELWPERTADAHQQRGRSLFAHAPGAGSATPSGTFRHRL